MAWPTDDLTKVHLDAGTDDPSQARGELVSLIDKVKAMIAGVTSAATASMVVIRDASGDFLARHITAVKFIGDVTATNGTVVLENGTDGTDASVRGDVKSSNGTTVLDSGTDGTDATFTGDVVGNAATATGVLTGFSGSQTFTSSGDFTVPAGVNTIFVSGCGGGGGGGSNTSGGTGPGGGGGGGGVYALGIPASVTPAASIAITVGAGGAGGTTGGNGSAGGDTVLAGILTLRGGGGGYANGSPGVAVAIAPTTKTSGGTGGTDADFATAGGDAVFYSGGVRGEFSAGYSGGGGGGGGLYGAGGAGGTATNGSAAAANSGGGGGGAAAPDGSYLAGGAGGSGKLVVFW